MKMKTQQPQTCKSSAKGMVHSNTGIPQETRKSNNLTLHRVSGPVSSWEMDGETVGIVSDFIFWGSKMTEDGDCSHAIKKGLLFGRKVMTKLDSILKSRGITLPTKVHLVKAMVFPVVIYGCESWTIKRAECR